MQFLNARLQFWALLAVAMILTPLAAMAAETQRPKSFSVLEDDGPIPKRAPVHHVAQDERQRDIDSLKAEVQKLRAEAEMCRVGSKSAK